MSVADRPRGICLASANLPIYGGRDMKIFVFGRRPDDAEVVALDRAPCAERELVRLTAVLLRRVELFPVEELADVEDLHGVAVVRDRAVTDRQLFHLDLAVVGRSRDRRRLGPRARGSGCSRR